MTTNEMMEINIKFQPCILNAPKIKLKTPKICPTPLSLNNSYIKKEDNFDIESDSDSDSDSDNSSYENVINKFYNHSKSNENDIITFVLKN